MYLIGDQVEILEDPNGTLTYDQARKADAFKKNLTKVPNMGLGRSAFWIRFQAINTGQDHAQFVTIANPEIETIDGYVQLDGQPVIHYTGGQRRDIKKWTKKDLYFTLSYTIEPQRSAIIYIRVKSEKQLQVPIYAGSTNATLSEFSFRDGFAGAYVGLMLVMLLYNLFIFASTRDKDYLIYVIYIFFVGLTQANFLGIGKVYLWGGSNLFASKASMVLTVITAVLANIFMHEFIRSRQTAPKLIKYGYVFYAVFSIGLILIMSKYSTIGYNILQVAAASMAVYQLLVGAVSYWNGSRAAGYFLVAWSAFLVGIILYVIKDLGFLPYNGLTKNMMTIGSAVEVVLLSFGLADKINVLRMEKEISQAEALRTAMEKEQIILDQNIMLEQKVTERTHALQESTDHLKRTQSQLVSAEKMASLGQLTAGIAHEINNPLNFISSNIPPLKRDIEDLKEILNAYRDASTDRNDMAAVRELEERIGVDYTVNEVDEILRSMQEGATRTSEIVRGLRTFSRLDEDDLKPADINEGLRSTVVVLGPELRDAVEIEYELADLPQVECYPGKLNQVFMNILNNAAHAVKQRHGATGGRVWITTRQEGNEVLIAIRDNGMGMDESTQKRLFEPFYTTKAVGEGTGLGLSIVQGVIDKHHGRITLTSEVNEGSEFIISLPVTQFTEGAKHA